MAKQPKSDLELASVDELASELVKRFDNIAIVGVKIYDGNRYGHCRRVQGNPYTVAGLMDDWRNMFLNAARKRAERSRGKREGF